MSSVTKLCLIFIAGGLGSISRYGMGLLAKQLLPAAFPWGTFLVNILGSFLFGVVWSLSENALSAEIRLILLVGFMGAFTTFSTFIYENHQLWQSGQVLHAILNIVAQVVVGFTVFALAVMLFTKA